MRSTGNPGAATRKGSGLEPGVELMPVIPETSLINTAKRSISQCLKFFD